MRFGQHPAPERTLAHVSDTHVLARGAMLAGIVDTEAHLRDAMARLEQTGRVDAIILSGDLADRGEPEAYELVRQIVEPVSSRMGARVIVAAGNHDERAALRAALLDDGLAPDAPIDAVHDLDGLRVVVLDSSLPGFHHGGFDPGQDAWLEGVLAEPAPLGTILVMHHPPLPYRSELMRILEFRDEARLAAILARSDVRLILSGHLHINGSGTIAGIPVSLVSATSYADDLGHGTHALMGIDDAQSFQIVEVYRDRVTCSVVPALPHAHRPSVPQSLYDELASLDDAGRIERFSRKPG